MDKLSVMQVAALLTGATCGIAGGNLAISADISDANVRSKNLMVWEVFRIFYHAVIKALADDNPDTGWPAPAAPTAGKLAGAVGSLPAVLGNPALAPLLQQLSQALTPPAGPPPAASAAGS